MTNLLKLEDRREYGVDGDKPGALAVCLALVVYAMLVSCFLSVVGVIAYLSRILPGW